MYCLAGLGCLKEKEEKDQEVKFIIVITGFFFLSFFLSLQSFLCSKNHRHWWVWLWLWYSLLTFFFCFYNFLKFHFFLLIFFNLSRRFWNSKQNFPHFCFVLIHFLLTYEYCFYLFVLLFTNFEALSFKI